MLLRSFSEQQEKKLTLTFFHTLKIVSGYSLGNKNTIWKWIPWKKALQGQEEATKMDANNSKKASLVGVLFSCSNELRSHWVSSLLCKSDIWQTASVYMYIGLQCEVDTAFSFDGTFLPGGPLGLSALQLFWNGLPKEWLRSPSITKSQTL